ncbi:Z1 domain-containing protein [Tunturiibacter gelidoferens]|uniref:Z1 domain-containing protein n=1 Tax=Tunturiibacter gelidiferens TaxID=3069689 RepID=A0AAU7Z3M0_9BACT
MAATVNIAKLQSKATLTGRYLKQLSRLHSEKIPTDCIEKAVTGAVEKLAMPGTSAMVIYGEPQSGKTEMMICLTAKLLDEGHKIIVHLLNDSVDLLTQNLKRFKHSGLAPAARNSTELLASNTIPKELVVICKKNSSDLQNLIYWLKGKGKVAVIDDEADYATPNSGINKGTITTINKWVGQLIGSKGYYIGVTATPARLNLNDTFQNDTKRWVKFPPHSKYTGQEVFFPLDTKGIPYRLTRLDQGGNAEEAEDALVRFLVTSAYLNSTGPEKNYTMLVHTSGKKDDHAADRAAIEKSVEALLDGQHSAFTKLTTKVHKAAQQLYPSADPQALTEYVVENASRTTLIVLNSRRDRKAAGDSATDPTSPFTIVIGGNIVSRGVTFPNLLSMFFTRNVKNKLQQDTYIQRARMFGARGSYLKHFELTIPSQLYDDWQKCFIFHRLALATIESNLGVPVWVGDSRVAVAGNSSINKATVSLDKGEMSFGLFDYSSELEEIIQSAPTSVSTLEQIRDKVGNDAIPTFVIDFLKTALKNKPDGSLAIHASSSIANYGPSADKKSITRAKGFLGKPQLEAGKFPIAIHHVKIFYNKSGKAKLYYKIGSGGVAFIQNLKKAV